MIASFKLLNVDRMEAEMTMRMTVGEWKKLKEQLPDNWVCIDFARAIRDVISAADAHFAMRTTEDEK